MNATLAALLIALSFLFVLAAGWCHEHKAHQRTKKAHARTYAALVESEEFRDMVKRSSMRGAPAIRWDNPYPQPASDKFYWLHFEEGAPHLHTNEARDEAIDRGVALYTRWQQEKEQNGCR